MDGVKLALLITPLNLDGGFPALWSNSGRKWEAGGQATAQADTSDARHAAFKPAERPTYQSSYARFLTPLDARKALLAVRFPAGDFDFTDPEQAQYYADSQLCRLEPGDEGFVEPGSSTSAKRPTRLSTL